MLTFNVDAMMRTWNVVAWITGWIMSQSLIKWQISS